VLATIDLPLVLGADNVDTMRTWVDASYAVHDNMRSHTGGTISFGIGTIGSKSNKQKLNTKSSTEAELVGASDYLPTTIWVMNFLQEQGYPVQSSFFEQDNQSAIKMEKNGRMSAGQRSRHVNIRYFWIADRLKSEKIKIQYCPTQNMLADFLSKPLQGSLFVRLRDVLLGLKPVSSLVSGPTDEERVGGNTSVVQPGPTDYTWADIVRKGCTNKEKEVDRTVVAPCGVTNGLEPLEPRIHSSE